jgi:hypothetical protein
MSSSEIITTIGLSIIFFYAIIKILIFYGFSFDVYGTYIIFYSLMVLSVLILPNSEPEV